jgi:hypothetical protein
MPTKEWLEKWKSKRSKTVSPVDLNEYFTKSIIAGMNLDLLDLGKISIPTGELLVRDPLCYLTKNELPYFQKTPAGVFSVTACVVLSEDDCDRYAAVKVDFTDEKAIRFEEALTGIENIEDLKENDFFGFNVDAGLATIVDKKVRDAYCDFLEKWENENPDKNYYDDYFAAIFAQSYHDKPEHQREGGDWINWTIPGTDLNMQMFQSGFGDGAYPVFFGFDKNENICCVVIQFIDIELSYSDENIEE